MIKNVSDLLKAFVDEEKKKIAAYAMSHAPTIGDMFEGLTKELLIQLFVYQELSFQSFDI